MIVKIRQEPKILSPFLAAPTFLLPNARRPRGRPDSTKPHGVRRASPTSRERALLLLLPLLLLLFEQSQVNISKSLVIKSLETWNLRLQQKNGRRREYPPRLIISKSRTQKRCTHLDSWIRPSFLDQASSLTRAIVEGDCLPSILALLFLASTRKVADRKKNYLPASSRPLKEEKKLRRRRPPPRGDALALIPARTKWLVH